MGSATFSNVRICAFVIVALVVGVSVDARAQVVPQPVDIPIQNLTQGTPVWCWAAVAQQLIMHAVGPSQTPQQCALVAIANGAAPGVCCGGVNPACFRTGSWPQIQALIAHFGGRYSRQAPPTDPMTLYRTLAAGRPIILQVRSSFASTHVVVLRGMSFVPGPMGPVPVLHINDPMSVFTQPVPYHQLLPLWIDALVVERNWTVPAGPTAGGTAPLGGQVSGPGVPPIDRDVSSRRERCRSECRSDHSSCLAEIETVDACLESRVEGCMDACLGSYGLPYDQCRNYACRPGVGANISWRSTCQRGYSDAVQDCRSSRDSCLSACSD